MSMMFIHLAKKFSSLQILKTSQHLHAAATEELARNNEYDGGNDNANDSHAACLNCGHQPSGHVSEYDFATHMPHEADPGGALAANVSRDKRCAWPAKSINSESESFAPRKSESAQESLRAAANGRSTRIKGRPANMITTGSKSKFKMMLTQQRPTSLQR